MSFYKILIKLMWVSIFCLTILVNYNKEIFFIDLSYLNNFSIDMNFSTILNKSSIIFLWMVSAVSTMVCYFSIIYLDRYNNKKFLSLKMFFIFSMVLLSISNSEILMLTGWDLLGLSSMFLIMFYPNKVSSSNSILTLMFNRLGDVLLILLVIFCLFKEKEYLELFSDYWSIWMIVFCCLTKSAQFPTSSWLPAAMSAPTPISAMVHSSTLVTAGILIIDKYKEVLNMEMFKFLLWVSMASFMLGGLMANSEIDYKKMIAYSTMSQISLVMMLMSVSAFTLAFLHMIYHAMFKTLLFCCAGMMFMENFGSQSMKMMFMKVNFNYLKVLTFSSIYAMSGLTYSNSYYSKDIFIENIHSMGASELNLLILISSSLTILYCSKLMLVFKPNLLSFKSFLKKKTKFLGWTIFLSLIFMNKNLSNLFLNKEMVSMISYQDILFILIFMLLPILTLFKIMKLKKLQMLSKNVGFMTNYFSYFLKNKIINDTDIYFNDLMFFKKKIMISENYLKFKFSFTQISSLLTMIITVVLILI